MATNKIKFELARKKNLNKKSTGYNKFYLLEAQLVQLRGFRSSTSWAKSLNSEGFLLQLGRLRPSTILKLLRKFIGKGNYHLLAEIDGKERKFVIGKNKEEFALIEKTGIANLFIDQLRAMVEKYFFSWRNFPADIRWGHDTLRTAGYHYLGSHCVEDAKLCHVAAAMASRAWTSPWKVTILFWYANDLIIAILKGVLIFPVSWQMRHLCELSTTLFCLQDFWYR